MWPRIRRFVEPLTLKRFRGVTLLAPRTRSGPKGFYETVHCTDRCLERGELCAAQTTTSSTTGAAADANPNVRHVIGLDAVKHNATGKLTVEDGALAFKTGKAADKVPVSSINDVFIGTETTQAGGKKGRAVKTAAIAAPYESGRALNHPDAYEG